MAAFSAAGTTSPQPTYAQHNWGVPAQPSPPTTVLPSMWNTAKATIGVTVAAVLASMPSFGVASIASGTTAPGGFINYPTRGLGQVPLLSHNSAEMAKIQDFMLARPAADFRAIERIHTLAAQSFASVGAVPSIEVRVEEEPEGPALFITVDTHGMDFDEQIRRELTMRESIWADTQLQAAKNYVVISVF